MPPFYIGPIRSDGLLKLNRQQKRYFTVSEVIGGRSSHALRGIESPVITVTGHFNRPNAILYGQQLEELADNPDYQLLYCQFPASEYLNNGWYQIEQATFPREVYHRSAYHQFELTLRKLGGSDLRPATYAYIGGIENYTGWTNLTTTNYVALPVGAYFNPTGEVSISTSEGNSAYLVDPVYNLSSYWLFGPDYVYKGATKVYDTVSPNNQEEATWVQVFGKTHSFSGDIVIQNGRLRYKLVVSGGVYISHLWAWDDVSTPNNWLYCGQFLTGNTSNDSLATYAVEFITLTTEEVRWRELRTHGNVGHKLDFSLRRNANWLRVSVEMIDVYSTWAYYRLFSGVGNPNFYGQVFNSAASGTQGASGGLPLDTSMNYVGAYVTTRNVICGFLYLTPPISYQPNYMGVSGTNLSQGNDWSTGTGYTFFILAFGFNTAAFNLGSAQIACANYSAYALTNTRQSLVLSGATFHV